MVALDVDEPLWHLSKFGCVHRSKENSDCANNNQCPVNQCCVSGNISIIKNKVELDT